MSEIAKAFRYGISIGVFIHNDLDQVLLIHHQA